MQSNKYISFIRLIPSALFLTFLPGTFSQAFAQAPSPASIQKIMGAASTSVLSAAGGDKKAGANEAIQKGDTITTGAETVNVTLANGNEIFVGPHTSVKFSDLREPLNDQPAASGIRVVQSREDEPALAPRDYFELKSGMIWLLTATGFDLSHPAIVQTPELITGIARSNVIIDYATASKGLSVAVFEGSVKVGKALSDVDKNKKVQFVSAGLRLHAMEAKIYKPKRFKRSVISSYVHAKAPEISSEMSRRGYRALYAIAAKYRHGVETKKQLAMDEGEGDITWNPTTEEKTPDAKELEMKRTLSALAEATASALSNLPRPAAASAPSAAAENTASAASIIPAATVGTSAGPTIIPPPSSKNSL